MPADSIEMGIVGQIDLEQVRRYLLDKRCKGML